MGSCDLITSLLLYRHMIRLRFLMFQIVWLAHTWCTATVSCCSLRLMMTSTLLLNLWLLLAGPLLLLLQLLHLHLLLLASINSLSMVRVIRMEVIPRGDLLRHWHGWRRKDLFLLDCLFLLLLEQFLFFHALATNLNFAETSADILKFEVGAGGRAGVLLVTLLLRIDALVVGEVDIVYSKLWVYVFLFCWFSCHCLLLNPIL